MAEILTEAPPRIAADAAAKMTAAEWKVKLSDFEFQVLRNKATERPRTGEYDSFYPSAGDGYFVCRGCGNPLYSAESKFKSGCGWPAFDKCYKGSVKIIEDNTHGMRRVEILCNNCDGHLGHGKLLRLFEGERMTPTNERHCVNSASVKFVKGVPPAGFAEAKVL
eukprot:jgi/Chrpa1/3640/Chrysochromulina_OHIO_Genome00013590-RA